MGYLRKGLKQSIRSVRNTSKTIRSTRGSKKDKRRSSVRRL